MTSASTSDRSGSKTGGGLSLIGVETVGVNRSSHWTLALHVCTFSKAKLPTGKHKNLCCYHVYNHLM